MQIIKYFFFLVLVILTLFGISHASNTKPRGPSMPKALGGLIVKHSELMFKKGYYQNISEDDYYHGHLVLPYYDYDSFESLLADDYLLIYHTDEDNSRWKKEKSIKPEQRTQRSIVGYPDGSVCPAIELLKNYESNTPRMYYEEFGSIFARYIGGMDRIFYKNNYGQIQEFINEFEIESNEHGDFVINEKRYDIYFLGPPAVR